MTSTDTSATVRCVMIKWTTLLSSVAAGLLLTACGDGEKAASTSEAVDPNVIAYPLDACIVADKKLGSMGKPYVFVHEGRQFKYCCKGCDDEFQANTDKYIKKFDDAVAANKAAEAKPAEAADTTANETDESAK